MEENNRDYTNGEITVHWQPSKCIHSTICYSRLRSVFDPVKRPWVNMNGASTDKIIEIVNQCPTDALTFSYNKDLKKTEEINSPEKKEKEPMEIEPSTTIQIMKNGPAIISGSFTIKDFTGISLQKASAIALCRCGHSNNMPFCDGSHNKSGFTEKR
ncbi:MAG: (4Fe-4S)-binding protein [Bacteroidales bacterium]